MRRSLFVASVLAIGLSSSAQAGNFHDFGRELATDGILGLPAAVLSLATDPTYSHTPQPLPYEPDPAEAYTRWLTPKLRSGMALYNRPCTFSDGVTTRVVACPVQGALTHVHAVPYPVVQQEPLVETFQEPVDVNPGMEWRHHRHHHHRHHHLDRYSAHRVNVNVAAKANVAPARRIAASDTDKR